MIGFGTDDVRRHTSVSCVGIYIDHAMPEHIACALVEGLVLGLSPGRFILAHNVG